MATYPWTSEHALDAGAVQRIVGEQFSDLAGAEVRYLDEGWESVAYEVGGEWIFRFPKRPEAEASQDVEWSVLPGLAPRLPIAVPLPARRGAPSAACPHRFHGYRKLPGTPAVSLPLDAIDVAECGEQLSAFLTALHSFPADEARSLGVPVRVDPGAFERWRGHAVGLFPSMAPGLPGDLAARMRQFLGRPPPAPHDGRPVLVHYDLGDAHMLIDVAARRVSGVIDWGDMCLGDPAVDFAGLVQWLGGSFLPHLLRSYRGAPVDEGFLERARAGAVFSAFTILWYGIEGHRPEYVRSGLRSLAHSLPDVDA